jgi:hypothetical protein
MINFFRVSSLGDHRAGKKRKADKPHSEDTTGHGNHGSSTHAGKPNGDYAESFARI